MTDVLGGGSGGRIRAKAVTARLDPAADLRTADGFDGSHDPHVWFDVRLWMKCVEQVRDEFAATDPAHADAYRANADRYLKDLAALDAEVREKANRLPKDRRILVTAHDAFGYFGRAYGFEVHGLQGVSTAAETGTKDVKNLAAFLGSRKIPAVFGETSVPSAGLKAVLDAVRADHKHDVRLVGEALYSDALGEPGTSGETYAGMVRHNIDTIVGELSR
jgi:manganese/zinc/iron transport system substrate-binding protein